jgi:hypothetical protein
MLPQNSEEAKRSNLGSDFPKLHLDVSQARSDPVKSLLHFSDSPPLFLATRANLRPYVSGDGGCDVRIVTEAEVSPQRILNNGEVLRVSDLRMDSGDGLEHWSVKLGAVEDETVQKRCVQRTRCVTT